MHFTDLCPWKWLLLCQLLLGFILFQRGLRSCWGCVDFCCVNSSLALFCSREGYAVVGAKRSLPLSHKGLHLTEWSACCWTMTRNSTDIPVTGWPVDLSSVWAQEHNHLFLDPGLKRHFQHSLDVWLKPITIHHFQAPSDLLVAIGEWYTSTLFQPKFLLDVLKDTAKIHRMSLRRPVTGGRQPDNKGKNEAPAPMLSPKIFGESCQDRGQQPVFSWAPSSHLWGEQGPYFLVLLFLRPSQDDATSSKCQERKKINKVCQSKLNSLSILGMNNFWKILELPF